MTPEPAQTQTRKAYPVKIIATYVAGILVFIVLLTSISRKVPIAFDSAIQNHTHSMISPAMTAVAKLVTTGGSTAAIVASGAGIFSWIYYKKRQRAAIFFGASLGGAIVLNQILKHLIERPRPDLWAPLVPETGFSFPSGHTMASAALAISLIALLWPTKWRWAALAGGVVYMYAVGCSRIYLGVHYPTDIIGAWIASGLWVLTMYIIIKPETHEISPHR